MADGVWTIGVHPNTITDEDYCALELFIAQHAAEFLSVEAVEQRWGERRKHIYDTLESGLRLRRHQVRRFARPAPRVVRKSPER